MKTTYTLFCTITVLTVFCATAFAQDPDWHKVPKDNLVEHGADVIKIMLSTTDENAMLDLIKQPGEENDILRLKMFGYKRLGTHGSVKAVPELIKKLDLEKEGFYARYALETIPGTEVDDALCDTIKDLKKPKNIAGVLTTLGVRSEYMKKVGSKSAETAKAYLTNENADIRKAAAYTYALCAGDEAVEYFTKADIDSELADSGFLLAETFVKKGEKDKAIKIYDALAAADIRDYQKDSAVLWGILVRGNDGIPNMVAQLGNDAPKKYAIGLKASRELPPGAVVTKALIEQLDKQNDPFRKSLLVRAIGDRKDKESVEISRPPITNLAKSGDAKVRLAAIQSLKKIGDPSVLPALIDAANEADDTIATAANDTLSNLPGKEVDDAIVGLLEKGDTKTKVAAIKLIEDRRIASAFPLLNKALKDENGDVRKAALNALGQIASINEFPMLLDVLTDVGDGEIEETLVVLKSAGTRMPQNDVSDAVSKLFETAPTPLKIHLLDLLKEIGGAKAMDIVEQCAWGDDMELKDQATAILGQWRSPQDIDLVAKACRRLATEAPSNKYKVRGLRGYIRLARQFTMPEEKRIQICQEVFDLASRNEDKILIFDVYGRYPSLKMLELTMKHIDNEAFREKACEAAVQIGEKLQGKDPKIAEAMKKVIEVSKNNGLKDKAQIVLNRQ